MPFNPFKFEKTMHRTHLSPARSGFTLIELLVVIAIIALLAAILFPVFGRVRENARRTTCQSNLNQIEVAFQQYTQDYDEHYPKDTTFLSGNIGWADTMFTYLKSNQVLLCPDVTIGAPTSIYPNQSIGYTTYFYDSAFADQNTGSTVVVQSQVLNPTYSIILGDGLPGDASNRTIGCDYADSESAIAGSGCLSGGSLNLPTAAIQEHLGGLNLAFADGHVKWYPGNGNPGEPCGNSLGNVCTGSATLYNDKVGFSVSGEQPTLNVITP